MNLQNQKNNYKQIMMQNDILKKYKNNKLKKTKHIC